MRTIALLMMLVAPASANAADPALEAQLRRAMIHCGRAGYVLRPIAGGRLVITALPTIRQTPLSKADLRCIRQEVAKIGGWALAPGDGR